MTGPVIPGLPGEAGMFGFRTEVTLEDLKGSDGAEISPEVADVIKEAGENLARAFRREYPGTACIIDRVWRVTPNDPKVILTARAATPEEIMGSIHG